MMKKIVFATYAELPNLYDDDLVALNVLKKRGYEAKSVVWDSDFDWVSVDAIVVRSVWDYWLKYPEFLKWIDRVERMGVLLLNPPQIIRENTQKDYLRKLASKGGALIPTEWIPKGSNVKLKAAVDKLTGDEFVLKPSISGGAFETYRFGRSQINEIELKLKNIVATAGAMVQPMISTILSDGEISFLFYGGKFSHAAIKKGPENEFRIQRTFGGSVNGYRATDSEIAQARLALESYTDPSTLLYARIDMVRDPNDPQRLLLMEVEATEPNLFFLHDQMNPGAAERFVTALETFI